MVLWIAAYLIFFNTEPKKSGFKANKELYNLSHKMDYK